MLRIFAITLALALGTFAAPAKAQATTIVCSDIEDLKKVLEEVDRPEKLNAYWKFPYTQRQMSRHFCRRRGVTRPTELHWWGWHENSSGVLFPIIQATPVEQRMRARRALQREFYPDFAYSSEDFIFTRCGYRTAGLGRQINRCIMPRNCRSQRAYALGTGYGLRRPLPDYVRFRPDCGSRRGPGEYID